MFARDPRDSSPTVTSTHDDYPINRELLILRLLSLLFLILHLIALQEILPTYFPKPYCALAVQLLQKPLSQSTLYSGTLLSLYILFVLLETWSLLENAMILVAKFT